MLVILLILIIVIMFLYYNPGMVKFWKSENYMGRINTYEPYMGSVNEQMSNRFPLANARL